MRPIFSPVRRLPFVLALFLLVMSAAGAAPVAEPAPGPGELVYADGDRVHGRLLRREGELLIIQSNRFGELRVPAGEVTWIPLAGAPAAPVAAKAGEPVLPPPVTEAVGEDNEPAPWYHLRPVRLTQALRTVFGSWHGRLALSSEVVTDTTDRSALTVEGSLRRSWKRDEVKVTARYDYSETKEVTSTDTIKGEATWNHSLGHRWYTVYRPTLEWNRAFTTSAGVPTDYVLLQQEVGLGLSLYKGAKGKLSIGLAENLFDVWATNTRRLHESNAVESGFVETEWKLPWQITLSDRGVLYYSSGEEGWENRFQIDKKLTETLSVGLSHELRYNNPDVRISDYRRLKIMLGLDF